MFTVNKLTNMKITYRKPDIIREVLNRMDDERVTKKLVEDFYDILMFIVGNALCEGNDVSLNKVGKLSVTKRKSWEMKHPLKGYQVQIPDTNCVHFKSSSTLKRLINDK